MNFGEILHRLLQIFHFIGGDDGGKNVTTFDPFNTTYTPVIYDPTTLTRISESNNSVSPIITSIFPSGYPSEEKLRKTSLVTGITAEPEVTNSTVANETTSEVPEPSNETTTSSGNTTSETRGTTSSGNTTDETGGTTSSGNSTDETGGTTSSGNTTGETGGTTSSGNTTDETGGTTSSGNSTGETGQTVTGSGGSTTEHATDVPPTAEPSKGLSRGAVAGIVIGCLLLVAVIAAAVVFFVRNRNSEPEHQRLRV